MKKTKKVDYTIELDGNRLYLETPKWQGVQVKIDVTALWHLFKEINSQA